MSPKDGRGFSGFFTFGKNYQTYHMWNWKFRLKLLHKNSDFRKFQNTNRQTKRTIMILVESRDWIWNNIGSRAGRSWRRNRKDWPRKWRNSRQRYDPIRMNNSKLSPITFIISDRVSSPFIIISAELIAKATAWKTEAEIIKVLSHT